MRGDGGWCGGDEGVQGCGVMVGGVVVVRVCMGVE